MIKHKKKICIICGTSTYIFSHGKCKPCYLRTYTKKIKRVKPTIQDNTVLNETKVYFRAYQFGGGRNYINGIKVPYTALKPHNFAHVLSKKLFPYFKYYHKNIVVMSLAQHSIYDQGTVKQLIRERIWEGKDKKKAWKELFALRIQLKQEYKQWVKENKGVYKIDNYKF